MKFCPKCEKNKKDECFASRGGDKLASYCKVCQSDYCKDHYNKHKEKYNKRRYLRTKATRKEHSEKIRDIKNNVPCTDCGVPYPHYVLEFDHLSDKVANVSEMPGKYGWDKIQEEIDKCEIVCSNCHKKRTYNRRNGV